MMEIQDKALISSIESFTTHDGPGCRTTIFFAGCPLKCDWCANPEAMESKRKILFAEQNCRARDGCSRCVKACPHGALRSANGALQIDRGICTDCISFHCTEVCHLDAIRLCGKDYTADQLMERLRIDSGSWGEGGGVTFSGGEPLRQAGFLLSLLPILKRENIHTAIETSAFAAEEVFQAVMDEIDFAFIDIKHVDPTLHHSRTGVDNTPILSNITALARSGYQGRLIIRVPMVAGYNDTVENMTATARFMSGLDLKEINLLRFHRLGESKWRQLGKESPYDDKPSAIDLSGMKEIFAQKGIACYIGEDTPF
ncbi:4-hydroxyphenylacetate decarboxylase subunit A [Syntrophobotulus glycolicus DSM 8271]|uniref:4-hydroxyphenylacetate decarboxylase subunit A n=1 Tax=Syntrophobotulus glycolicus (strain DSM 8271 / FlGlyR) TaxID=645991 RepID=F0SW33_SYNGF|nr:4-hydroxyphenylacetate decarboxylase activase [Syntrophobotulus glycolicus]ADY56817.1 4-hydroxyphenylacetate decarboxylase subunit A [Syntrophobotulus glycolicus DSM 8271]